MIELQVGKQYFTRSGLITQPIETNENNPFFPLKGLVLGKPDLDYLTWDNFGNYTTLPSSENELDLVKEYVPNNEVRVKEEVLKIIDEEINKINELINSDNNDFIDQHTNVRIHSNLIHLKSKIEKL